MNINCFIIESWKSVAVAMLVSIAMPISIAAAPATPRYGIVFGQTGNEVEMQVVPARQGIATNTMPKPGDSAVTAIVGAPVTRPTTSVPPRTPEAAVELKSETVVDYKEDGFDEVIDSGNEAPDPISALSDELDGSGRVSITGILFDFDRATIKASSISALNTVLALMQGRPTLSIRIEGYTDPSGKSQYNRKLSEKRAEAVKRWLTDKGIDDARMTAVGKGERGNIDDSSAQMAKHRRVDIVKISE